MKRFAFLARCLATAFLAIPSIGVAQEEFDPATLKPFTAGEKYLGEHETGLYSGGKNEIPEAHRRAGERLAATIQPLDVEGNPDPEKGRIVAVSMGHSNVREYFNAFAAHLQTRDDLHPRFEFFNCGVGGQIVPRMMTFRGGTWQAVEQVARRPGYSPKQVQVLFLHPTTNTGNRRANAPEPTFPEMSEQMTDDLRKILERFVETYPNVKIAYLTSDGYRGLARQEPFVWWEAFAIKWLIQAQIEGKEGTAFEGPDRKLPWLQWGPYIWDSSWTREQLRDGVHPSDKGKAVFVEKYWGILKEDPVAQPWMFAK
ncbi:MAG: SGNH/GDSL hydrolase family protein [Planctomycetaceae bacterium]